MKWGYGQRYRLAYDLAIRPKITPEFKRAPEKAFPDPDNSDVNGRSTENSSIIFIAVIITSVSLGDLLLVKRRGCER